MQQPKSPAILIYGSSGSGKTTSITTLCACPEIEHVRVLATESQTLTRLRGISTNRLDWKLIAPLRGSGVALRRRIETITRISWDAASKNPPDPDKGNYKQLLEVMDAQTAGFIGDRTGTDYGPISSWGPNVAFVLDTLTGLGQFCLTAVCGIAVIRTMPQWYAAMQLELMTIDSLLNDTNAWVIVFGHDDPYRTNEGILYDIKALGAKNAPEIKPKFGEIIYAERTSEQGRPKYIWSNTRANTQCKPGILPPGDDHPQDFAAIIKPYYAELASQGEITKPNS